MEPPSASTSSSPFSPSLVSFTPSSSSLVPSSPYLSHSLRQLAEIANSESEGEKHEEKHGEEEEPREGKAEEQLSKHAAHCCCFGLGSLLFGSTLLAIGYLRLAKSTNPNDSKSFFSVYDSMVWFFGAIALLSSLIGAGMFLTSWYRRTGNSSNKRAENTGNTLEYLELGEVNKQPPLFEKAPPSSSFPSSLSSPTETTHLNVSKV